ncbi:MAG TPA: FxsA family protein [Polyangiales bacterium]|nr:FxsA family protein [Polyangiales bacterium]
MRALFLLFAVLPLLEVYILFKLGRAYGAQVPVLAIALSAVCGILVARTAGLRVLSEWRRALASGTPPDQGVIGGVLVLLGCALLVLPGLVSDAIGLGLLFPPLRRVVARQVTQRAVQAIQRGTLHVAHAPARPNRRSVIDVEGEVIDAPHEIDDAKQLKP